jgi:hypothetical protein
MLLTFGAPGILLGSPPEGAFAHEHAWIWYSFEIKERVERLRRPGDKAWAVRLRFKPDIFARVLAKIAHTTAIAHFGIDSFRPLLPGVILGTDKNVPYLVGGYAPPTDPDPPLAAGRHNVSHQMAMCIVRNDSGHHLLFATIRLFPFTGAPTYSVVVGEPGRRILDQLEVPVQTKHG